MQYGIKQHFAKSRLHHFLQNKLLIFESSTWTLFPAHQTTVAEHG